MTNQEIFDIALSGILNQGCASIDAHGVCMYRGLNGAKCAIGHAISDEEYTDRMEGLTPAAIQRRFRLFDGIEELFLAELQNTHDLAAVTNIDFLDAFKLNIEVFAEEHSLVIPEGLI